MGKRQNNHVSRKNDIPKDKTHATLNNSGSGHRHWQLKVTEPEHMVFDALRKSGFLEIPLLYNWSPNVVQLQILIERETQKQIEKETSSGSFHGLHVFVSLLSISHKSLQRVNQLWTSGEASATSYAERLNPHTVFDENVSIVKRVRKTVLHKWGCF